MSSPPTAMGYFFLLLLTLVASTLTAIKADPTTSQTLNADFADDDQKKAAASNIIQALTPLATDRKLKVDLKDVLEDARLLFGNLLESDKEDGIYYADRLVGEMLDTVNDPDCMSGELDASDPFFRPEQAIQMFQKCKLLVLRNVFPKETLERYKLRATSYLKGLESERISPTGKTTYGENYFYAQHAPHRWDVCFTKDLVEEDIVANDLLMELLHDDQLLGEDFSLLDFGVVISEPGAPHQRWHSDGSLFQTSMRTSGIGGHDLPSYAIGVMTPLLNITAEHGPTEFCMGYSNLAGMEERDLPIKDETLEQKFEELLEFEKYDACPPQFLRTPMLNFGDMLLFDYEMVHRGGENCSPDLRTIIYNTYSRRWYKDINFESDSNVPYSKNFEKETELSSDLQDLIHRARIAIPDKIDVEDPDDEASLTLDTLEKMGQLRPSYFRDIHEDEDENETTQHFIITNLDVDIPYLEVVVENEIEQVSFDGDLQRGHSRVIKGKAGDRVRVLTREGVEVKAWSVDNLQYQLVLKSEFIDNDAQKECASEEQ